LDIEILWFIIYGQCSLNASFIMAPGKSHFARELEPLSPMSLSRVNYFLKA